MGRIFALVMTFLFMVVFAVLTIDGLVKHGLTFEGVVSAMVLVLLCVGFAGAMLHRRRRP